MSPRIPLNTFTHTSCRTSYAVCAFPSAWRRSREEAAPLTRPGPRSQCYRQPGSGVRSTRLAFGSAHPPRSSHLLCRRRAVKGSNRAYSRQEKNRRQLPEQITGNREVIIEQIIASGWPTIRELSRVATRMVAQSAAAFSGHWTKTAGAASASPETNR